MSGLSRRGILGGAAALVPVSAVRAGVPPLPIHPDAALIAASARFADVNRAFCAVLSAEVLDDHPDRAAWEAQEVVASDAADVAGDAVLALPCTTLAGVLALADAVVAHSPEVLNPSSYQDEALMRRLVLAVLALRGAA